MAHPEGRERAALVVLCAAVFLDSMDLSLMGVALPAIGIDLSLPESTLQWLMSGYAVAYGGFLLLGGRMADLFGRRRMFLLSLTVFAAASLAGGLLSSGWPLVATRVIKGVAAVTVLLPAPPVHGVGNGLSFPSLNIAAVGGLPNDQQGLASGLVTSAIQIGAGIGVAALAAVMALGDSVLAGYRLAFLGAGIFSLLGALIAHLGLRTPAADAEPARAPAGT